MVGFVVFVMVILMVILKWGRGKGRKKSMEGGEIKLQVSGGLMARVKGTGYSHSMKTFYITIFEPDKYALTRFYVVVDQS